MTIYFTADTHFGHSNILRYTNRPFRSVTEMNAALCENWVAHVRERDHIYHLGDVLMPHDFQETARLLEVLRKLPGRKFLIPGNHDHKYLSLLGWVFDEILPPIHELKVQTLDKKRTYSLVLAHYPLTAWNKSHHGALQLYGHVHGRFLGNQQQTDVGVDVWNYAPVTLDQILARLATLPPYQAVDCAVADEQDGEDTSDRSDC